MENNIEKQLHNLVERGIIKWQICKRMNLSMSEVNILLHKYDLYNKQTENDKYHVEIQKMHDAGMTHEQMAMKLNTNVFALKHRIRNIEFEPKKKEMKKGWNKWDVNKDEQLRELVKKGLSFVEIASKMNLTRNGVTKRWGRIKEGNTIIVKKHSPEKRNNIGVAKRYTPEEDKQLISLYKEGKTFAEIGKITGRTTWTVTQRYNKIKFVDTEVNTKQNDAIMTVENISPVKVSKKDKKIIKNINSVASVSFPININVNKGEIIKYLIDNNLIEIKIQ